MTNMSRRKLLQASAVGAIGSAPLTLSATTPLRARRDENASGIQLAELFSMDEPFKIRLAAQAGVRHAIVLTRPVLDRVPRAHYFETLLGMKSQLADAGLSFAGVESHPVSAERIKLGQAGRDEEIENYIAVLKALSKIGVMLVCYNWMAGLSWYRTRADLPGRGGALLSEFDNRVALQQGPTEWGAIEEASLWSNLEYFLRAVMPVAESLGMQMALHPDDPPISPLRGIGRILTSAEAFRRVLRMAPSPSNGITFCQANFKLMGEDLGELVREWCGQKKIFFVHLRDVVGTREHFRETFHDESPVDLARMLRLYHECGFNGPLRPDHAPTMEGESNDRPGYSMSGKLLAFGYIKGALDAYGIPYR
jgi:mannonate dehydratase